jgi:hypothetical protein
MSLVIYKTFGHTVFMADNQHQRAYKAGKPLPLAVPVQVQGDGFRCLAYRDENGEWVDYYSGERLKGELRVVEFHPD